jgi:tetratricopeptide (TPR) repeat protein
VRGFQALILARRGRPSEAAAAAEWAASQARAAAEPQFVQAFSVQAGIRLALGDPAGALAVLSEVEEIPKIREDPEYVKILPEIVATSLGAGDLHLATRLVQDVGSVWPLHEHVLMTVRALLTEHRGEHAKAAELFGDAAERWQGFEMPWERGQVLLGQGRCLLALGRPSEAIAAIRDAREVFATLGAGPALEETDALLDQAVAATS